VSPRRGNTLAFLGAALFAGTLAMPSCSAPNKGSLVVAITTDMQVPKDMDVLSVFVSTNGVPKYDFLGRVLPDGTVAMPSTLAIVEPDDPSAQVRIRVIGFQSQAGSENARVLRDVVTTVPHQQTALLRLPLSFLDDGSVTGTLPGPLVPDEAKGVPDGITTFDPTDLSVIKPTCDFSKGLTMIGGVCADDGVDSSKLPPFDAQVVFGDAGLLMDGLPASCFDVARCFTGASPAPQVDMQHCSFAVPAGTDATKMNLALESPTTGACVGDQCFVPLENDPTEGWTAQAGTVTMLPGVCKRIAAGATLYQTTAGGCSPQTEEMPLCQLAEGSDGGTPVDAGLADASEAAIDAGCAAGATRCSATLANTPEQCDATGTWQPLAACAGQACVGGVCAGTCAPGAMLCADRTTPAQCDATGTPVAQTSCGGAAPYCYLGACVSTFPSCQGGGTGADTACGAAGSADCCGSLAVTGGTFWRDDFSGDPATVADFRLDAFEVTVGRFRKFVNATAPATGAPWAPAAGSGVHAYLPGGGLLNGTLPEGGAADAGAIDATVEGGSDDSGQPGPPTPLYETGWDPTWETLPSTQQGWADALFCDATYATWTLSVGSAGDALPVNCVTWAEAEAFCIWDGGFLPSEAEWDYVASGGSSQQQFPWGNTGPSADANLAVYGCYYGATTPGTCTGVNDLAPVGSIAAGNDAVWGQSDLAGNVSEWTLDWYASPYAIASCANCALTSPPQAARAVRGGAFYDPSSALFTSSRSSLAPADRGANLGFRCARPPIGGDP
jgi:formylglycine-generating enzyme